MRSGKSDGRVNSAEARLLSRFALEMETFFEVSA
jgi:hypothetical protein